MDQPSLVNILAKDPVSFPTPTAVGSSRMLFSSPVFGADGRNKDVFATQKTARSAKIFEFFTILMV